MIFIEWTNRGQTHLLPACVDDYITPNALVRVVDAFVEILDLIDLGFTRAIAASTGRPGYYPGDMLRLYIWGYLNQVRSSRYLERACKRDLEAMWLMRQLAPDYRTIAAFRHDYPDAIVATSAAFVRFCREQNLVGGRSVALDGTKMRAGVAASRRRFCTAWGAARRCCLCGAPEHIERRITPPRDGRTCLARRKASKMRQEPRRDSFDAAPQTHPFSDRGSAVPCSCSACAWSHRQKPPSGAHGHRLPSEHNRRAMQRIRP